MLVNYSISLRALHRYVKAYNATQQHLKNHIRGPMLHTAQEIIRIYGVSLLKANRITPVTPDHIPSLRTNNKQLATLTHQSGRTIQRHIIRLQQAGIITHKIGHGSNASYELLISPNIMWIKGVTTPKTPPIARLADKKLSTDNQCITNTASTTCPHTDTGNTIKNTSNTLIAVDSLLHKWQTDPFKRTSAERNISKNTTGDTIQTKRSSLPLTGFSKKKNTSRNTSGDTREKALQKNTTRENADGREGSSEVQYATTSTGQNELSRHSLLVFYAGELWKLAREKLYTNTHLTHRQCTIAEQLLYQWYSPVETSKLKRAHQIYLERIDIVKKYIDKAPEKRFVQLPYRYFDPKNPTGFAGTKPWYNKQKRSKAQLRAQLILQHQLRKYKRNASRDTARRRPILEVYRECEQRIGKLKNQELLGQFYAAMEQPEMHL